MAAKHTNWMKATVWTPTMRSDSEGTPDSVISCAFYALRSPARRAACIAELQKIDARMTELEAKEKSEVPA